MIERYAARVSATVFGDNELRRPDCHRATCSGRSSPTGTSPRVGMIRATRSSYFPNDDSRTRWRATVSSHQSAMSDTVDRLFNAACAGDCDVDVTARTKATPRRAGISVPAEHRVRRDRIDSGGKVTLRYHSRLLHLGIGRRYRGTHVLLLVADRDVRVINHDGDHSPSSPSNRPRPTKPQKRPGQHG